jgi:tRNA G10  N-methylase Trm11
MYIALLGRQPTIGIAELERVFGGSAVSPISPLGALVQTDTFNLDNLGGTLKAGRVTIDLPGGDWHKLSQKIVQYYTTGWSGHEGKITLGISAYGFNVSGREVQKTGIILKQKLKKTDISLRLIPNTEAALSTATSHHNKLGLSSNKVELLLFKAKDGRMIVAESIGAQNITAYTKRDQNRPKRDAFVGMLPPKLAQIMINLAIGIQPNNQNDFRILDPFCGTGVVLQEAVLQGYIVYGTDLVEKMIDYSRENLHWLEDTHHVTVHAELQPGDAMTTRWNSPIDAVVSETYLGQPFSAIPSPSKLAEVTKNCNHIVTDFLTNLSSQIQPGTLLCIAVPAWRDHNGGFSHLPLIETIANLGYKPHEFHNVSPRDMLYYREDQTVARELLVLTKM